MGVRNHRHGFFPGSGTGNTWLRSLCFITTYEPEKRLFLPIPNSSGRGLEGKALRPLLNQRARLRLFTPQPRDARASWHGRRCIFPSTETMRIPGCCSFPIPVGVLGCLYALDAYAYPVVSNARGLSCPAMVASHGPCCDSSNTVKPDRRGGSCFQASNRATP